MNIQTLSWPRWAGRFGATRDAKREPAVVLVVDDEEPIRRFVERVLSEAGCRVATAGNAVEALSSAGKLETIDLLITDLMMPEMNGDELARRLRQADADLPVLYLTGFSDRLFVERQGLWEHEAFLDKPCSVKGLLEAAALVSSGQIAGAIRHRQPVSGVHPTVACTGEV